MARQETIKIEYPGSVISVNHYKGRRRDGGTYTKREAQAFMDELGWAIKSLHLEDWRLPLEITCNGYFRHWGVAPDLSNLSKVICDAIQEASGVNDKDFRWRDGERLAGYKDPYLLIIIKERVEPLASVSFMPNKSKSKGIGGKSKGNLSKQIKGGREMTRKATGAYGEIISHAVKRLQW